MTNTDDIKRAIDSVGLNTDTDIAMDAKDIARRSTETIGKMYKMGEVTAQKAIDALVWKDHLISSNPKNQQKGFYRYTPRARKNMGNIAWAIQRVIVAEKEKAHKGETC